jgi:Flp pilus assembly protein TadG
MKFPARLRILGKDNHGASLIELALVTPMLVLLVFGAIDLGRGYYVYLELVNAAHAGAEYGSLHPSDTANIIKAATKSNEMNVSFATPLVTYGYECSDGSSYTASATSLACTATATRDSKAVHRVQVNTSAVYTTFLPWSGIPSTFTLYGSATIRGNP